MSGRVEAVAVTNLIKNTRSGKISKPGKLLLTFVNSTDCLVDKRESEFPGGLNSIFPFFPFIVYNKYQVAFKFV